MHEITEVADVMESSLMADSNLLDDSVVAPQPILPYNIDKIGKAQTINCDIDLPKGKV